MKDKINIAELLKDCPKGMELDCTAFNNVKFQCADNDGIWIEYIDSDNNDRVIYLTCDGGIKIKNIETKCVIFPKGKNTWEGFQRPFKDGDIIFTHADCLKVGLGNTWISIFQEKRNGGVATYVDYAEDGSDYYSGLDGDKAFLCMESDILRQRFATEEEKEKLFKVIEDNGYKWNDETKTLEKLRQFKVGDIVRLKSKPNCVYTIHSLTWDDNKQLAYRLLPNNDKHLILVSLNAQDDYELVPNRFDINTLKLFESRVLVRDNKLQKWSPAIWGFYDSDSLDYQYKLVGVIARCCIPYEGNEHLLGTTNDCAEYFKTWK